MQARAFGGSAGTVGKLQMPHLKPVIVTGGARGIGFAIAKRLARSGVRIAVWDIESDAAARAAEALAELHLSVTCDVTDEVQVEDAATATWAAFGEVGGLVNNAASSAPSPRSGAFGGAVSPRARRQSHRRVPRLPNPACVAGWPNRGRIAVAS